MDWTKRCRSSDDGEIEKNQNQIEKSQMGSGKKWKCGDQIRVYVDELGEVEGEMGMFV